MIEFKPDAHDTGACAVSSSFSDGAPMICPLSNVWGTEIDFAVFINDG